MSERTEDLVLVEVDSYIEKMLEKYYKSFLGDRIGEVGNGENIYSQEGRQTAGVGEEVRGIDQLAPGG